MSFVISTKLAKFADKKPKRGKHKYLVCPCLMCQRTRAKFIPYRFAVKINKVLFRDAREDFKYSVKVERGFF